MPESYSSIVRERIRFLEDRLLAVARWAESSGVDAAGAEFLARPYRRLLDELNERDLPLAELMDEHMGARPVTPR